MCPYVMMLRFSFFLLPHINPEWSTALHHPTTSSLVYCFLQVHIQQMQFSVVQFAYKTASLLIKFVSRRLRLKLVSRWSSAYISNTKVQMHQFSFPYFCLTVSFHVHPSAGKNKYVGPPYHRAEMYAGHVACCPLVSHSKYANVTDRQTDSIIRHKVFKLPST